MLKGVQFDDVLTAFNDWAEQHVTIEAEEWMALDGNALASTVTEEASSYQNFVSLVSVFSHKRGQVLGAAKLENQKRSEIPTVRELIEALDLDGRVFTLDALHCQKKPSKPSSTAVMTTLFK
ncbi:MAG: ISAs1 family transposase [Candidatus Vecturithrix sp.]|nr:ISAs1 family transposase [Candidatus Vecturithrix sp.]